jgi:asparagine synthase (glutamine-hydrolysing)
MCGIAAIFSRNEPVSEDALRGAVATLRHRGPDCQRHWLSPDRHVGLGHARLSIIDLATGNQPIANEDESARVVVNGEFYDFERIRRELEHSGHRFRTRSDSEIALHLYEDLGVYGLTHLRGEFAFVLWDEAHQTLFAARDRFGIKPLFYSIRDDTLYLASEAKALFAAGVPARWDAEMVYQALTGPGLPDRTLFAEVHQVPPGYYLLASRGGVRLHRYWDFDYRGAAEPADPLDESAWVEHFRAALDEAVRLRLRADVPVGCYLSGGLDSSAVLGLAARHAARPIRTFTLTFDQADYDEGRIAEEMAARAGAEFIPIPIRHADLADHFAAAIGHAETLFINGHGIAKFLLSRAVRDAGYKVVFTGEGSDEVLGGYAHFRRDAILFGPGHRDPAETQHLLDHLEAANPVSRGLLLPAGPAIPLDSTYRTLGFVPSWFETIATAAEKRLGLLADDFSRRFAGWDPYRVFLNGLDVPGQLTGREPLDQSLYLCAKSVLPNYVLSVLGDRMEMAHSVEGRLPFLDHRVVELLCRMPLGLKIRGLTEKYVLREAARPILTDTIYGRQKHPFLAPPMTLKPDEPLFELLQDTLRGPSLAALPFFDQAKVIALLDRLPHMPDSEHVPWDPVLMTVLSTCILREHFRLEPG